MLDENVIMDAVYDLIAADATVTGAVADRIYANRVPREETPVFPLVLIEPFTQFAASRTLGSGIATYKGSYKVTGVYQDDPRAARDIRKALQQALSATVPAGFIDIFPGRSIYKEESEEGDGVVYISAGAIYTIEVTA